MVNSIYLILSTIELSNPAIFWLFFAALFFAVAITYTYRLSIGLLATFGISAFLYWVGEFIPYIYIPLVASIILLLMEMFGLTNLIRTWQNFINWLYLKHRIRRGKK